MSIYAIIDGTKQVLDHCPLQVTDAHHATICGHKIYLGSRVTLYCDYDHGKGVGKPSRCPLANECIDVGLEAV